ncbi:MAG TPA: efflux RND transporter periplasmic adaptor subunit [Planctomycetota bacterium]|nr:efflux RND transporter periplasmic adaptor subunit [Planctomycetota bacterium]
MSARDLVVTAAVLSCFCVLAVASLWIPVGEHPEADAPSAFQVDRTEKTIRVPEASARRIGLETETIMAEDEPVIARFTARTGFNLEHLAHVKAQFPGKIVDIGPELGSRVRGGETGVAPTLLCVVESVDLGNAKNAYQKARVQDELDEEALERTKQMISERVLGPKFLLDAEAAVKKDRADVEAARQNLFVFGVKDADLDKVFSESRAQRMAYEIRAPISGIIAEKNVTRGEYADNTVNLFTIADTSTLWVWGAVYEKDWGTVKVGQTMKIRLAAYPDQPIDSVVEFVSPEIDVATRSIMIRGRMDNSGGKILSDMYGTLLVTVDQGKDSILVPSTAVVRDLKREKAYLFVRKSQKTDGSATYERIPVQAVSVDAHRLRVTSGLSPGRSVVTRGALNLFEEMENQE